jgi:hypothetical protein
MIRARKRDMSADLSAVARETRTRRRAADNIDPDVASAFALRATTDKSLIRAALANLIRLWKWIRPCALCELISCAFLSEGDQITNGLSRANATRHRNREAYCR